MDGWAAGQRAAGRRVPMFGQLGRLAAGSYRPAHFDWAEFVPADRYRALAAEAGLLVAHAGMGSIITALELARPLLICPRRASLGEHRNDHQLATAARFEGRAGIHVAWEAADVPPLLDRLAAGPAAGAAAPPLAPHASPELLAAVRAFIHG